MSQVDKVVGSVVELWNSSMEKAPSLSDITTHSHDKIFQVQDPELNDASKSYFAAQDTLNKLSRNLALFRKSAASIAAGLQSMGSYYSAAFPEGDELAPKAASFIQNATSVQRADAVVFEAQFTAVVTETLAPLKDELAEVNTLRCAAVRIQYKIEQLERASADALVSKVIPDAKWLENARESLATAKPAFLTALNGYNAHFDDVRRHLFLELDRMKREFFVQLGAIERDALPMISPIGYWDIDDLDGIRPKA
jgi:predicted translin family RNA/ssDNA-binding protein